MNGLVKSAAASMKVLVTVAALVATAQAAQPYLPLIGPPPLRIQTVTSHVALSVVKIEAASTPSSLATNAPATITSNIPTVLATNPPSQTTAIAGQDNPPLPPEPKPDFAPVPEAGRPPGDTFNPPVFALPTPDLLGITPQTLATYFRPVQEGTNSTALIGLFPLSFVPPLPPEKSSHAEYIIK